MNKQEISRYLKHLSQAYHDLHGPGLEVAICGGAALNLLGLIQRVTQDVDLVSPKDLPSTFIQAIQITADHFQLKPDWVNQGPIDLLEMGLPEGFFERCQHLKFHPSLDFLIASRFDQIHFKLYASIDRGGYHVQDLKALKPNNAELLAAAQWTQTHDVSEAFKQLLIDFLQKQEWADVAAKVEK